MTAYQLSDQVYPTGCARLAGQVAVALAMAGGWSLVGTCHFWHLRTNPCAACRLAGPRLSRPSQGPVQRPGWPSNMPVGEEVGCHVVLSRLPSPARCGGLAASVASSQSSPGGPYLKLSLSDLQASIRGRNVLLAAHGFNVNRADG